MEPESSKGKGEKKVILLEGANTSHSIEGGARLMRFIEMIHI